MSLRTTGDAAGPADFTDVRSTNLAVVLRFVREHEPCSRSQIATGTGLNKATVSSLVAELLERRLLEETGLTENRIGRPAVMLVLDGRDFAAVGLAIGADHLSAVAVDLAGRTLLSWRQAFDAAAVGPHKAIARLTALARRAVGRVERAGHRVLGLTTAVPGLVEAGSGVVRTATRLGWHDLDLRSALQRALGGPDFPVGVENAAHLAAVAEHRYGQHDPATDHLVYLSGDVDLGTGVVCGGRPVRGARGYGGDLGHVQLDPAGPVCACGRRGCLEVLAGPVSLVSALAPGTDEALAELGTEIDDLVRRAGEGDQEVLGRLEEQGGWLGRGAALAISLLNPEVLVLGGHFVPLSPWLLPAAERTVRELVRAPEGGGCRLVASSLGFGAAALGGAASVLDTVDVARLPRTG